MLPAAGAFPFPSCLIVAPGLRLPCRLNLLDELRHARLWWLPAASATKQLITGMQTSQWISRYVGSSRRHALSEDAGSPHRQPWGMLGNIGAGAFLYALPAKRFRSTWMAMIVHAAQSVYFLFLILGLVLGLA